jgi:hypothetical protein
VKDTIEVIPDGFTKIMIKCIMPQYDWRNDYQTQNYVPSKHSSRQDVTWTLIPGTLMHQMVTMSTNTHPMLFCHQRRKRGPS